MNGTIRHQGIVDSKECGHVRVRIVQTSACASCHAAGRCSAAESKEKLIDVHVADSSELHVGDSVTVVANESTGLLAVMLCAVAPLVVLVTVLAAMLALTSNEATAACCGIASLIPYYILLYLLRGKIGARVAFRLETY